MEKIYFNFKTTDLKNLLQIKKNNRIIDFNYAFRTEVYKLLNYHINVEPSFWNSCEKLLHELDIETINAYKKSNQIVNDFYLRDNINLNLASFMKQDHLLRRFEYFANNNNLNTSINQDSIKKELYKKYVKYFDEFATIETFEIE